MATLPQLVAYIRQYKDRYPVAALKTQLLRQNIPEAEIDQAIRVATSAAPAQPAARPPVPGQTPTQPAQRPPVPGATPTPAQPQARPATPSPGQTPVQPGQAPGQTPGQPVQRPLPGATPTQPVPQPLPGATPTQPVQRPPIPGQTPAQPVQRPPLPGQTPTQPAQRPPVPGQTPTQPVQRPPVTGAPPTQSPTQPPRPAAPPGQAPGPRPLLPGQTPTLPPRVGTPLPGQLPMQPVRPPTQPPAQPAPVGSAPGQPLAPIVAPPPGRSYILCVDDDAMIRDMMVTKLEGAGYRVTSAEDAAQQVVQAEGMRLSLIISDIEMPGFGTGVDALKKLRASNMVRKNLPVIFLTGMPPNEARKLMPKNDPYVRLLHKPVDWKLLRQYIKDLTGMDNPLD